MTRSWWRRNAVALLVIVVSIPSLAWLLGGIILTQRLGNEPGVIPVAAGETAQFGGYRWTLTASDTFEPRDSEGESRPVGTELVAAIISVEPIPGDADDDASCDAVLTAPGPERVRRTWQRVGSPGDYLYRMADDTRGYCVLDGTAYEYETVFLVPEGSYGESAIDVTVTGSRTIHRFQLER